MRRQAVSKGKRVKPKPLTRSEVMARIRSKDTGPELILRRLLSANGWRFRLHYLTPGGKVDIAFPGKRIALQVDGCFWHGCPAHGVKPKTNKTFWQTKLEANRARDRRQARALRKSGWRLLRFWEHLVESNPDKVLARAEILLSSV
jgi:DNA mismatch endonuclease (patch repair protein)